MQAEQEQLIDKIKTGDQGAFSQLIQPYKGKAFGLCYSMVGNVEDAKDILQEALIKTYKNIGQFRKDSSFYTWFYALLVNTARDYLRRKKRQNKEITAEISDLHLSPERTETLVLTKELNQIIDASLNRLSEKQRLSFVMKHINGMKIEEIAQILHCRPATVKIHLFRAVRSLQKKLAPYLAANQ